MARIAGVDIPNDKRVVISLTYIYGIGLTTSKKVLEEAGISEDVRVKDLTEEQLNAIRKTIDAIKVEGDLRRDLLGEDLSRRNRNSDRNANGSYSGFRTFYFISCKFTFFSVKENVLPTPSSLRTVIRSPCASTICLTMASPSPVPPCSRDRPLSVR